MTPAALKVLGLVTTTSTGYFHSINLPQTVTSMLALDLPEGLPHGLSQDGLAGTRKTRFGLVIRTPKRTLPPEVFPSHWHQNHC